MIHNFQEDYTKNSQQSASHELNAEGLSLLERCKEFIRLKQTSEQGILYNDLANQEFLFGRPYRQICGIRDMKLKQFLQMDPKNEFILSGQHHVALRGLYFDGPPKNSFQGPPPANFPPVNFPPGPHVTKKRKREPAVHQKINRSGAPGNFQTSSFQETRPDKRHKSFHEVQYEVLVEVRVEGKGDPVRLRLTVKIENTIRTLIQKINANERIREFGVIHSLLVKEDGHLYVCNDSDGVITRAYSGTSCNRCRPMFYGVIYEEVS